MVKCFDPIAAHTAASNSNTGSRWLPNKCRSHTVCTCHRGRSCRPGTQRAAAWARALVTVTAPTWLEPLVLVWVRWSARWELTLARQLSAIVLTRSAYVSGLLWWVEVSQAPVSGIGLQARWLGRQLDRLLAHALVIMTSVKTSAGVGSFRSLRSAIARHCTMRTADSFLRQDLQLDRPHHQMQQSSTR